MRFGPAVELPDEIAARIFSFLPLSSISSVLCVSKEFQLIGDDKYLWKELAIRELNLTSEEVDVVSDFRAWCVIP